MGVRSDRGSVKFGPPERGKGADSRAARGRICGLMGCSTILSTYNTSGTCWLHTQNGFRHPVARS